MAEKVDQFIADHQENFRTESRISYPDGSVVYVWYMKWAPWKFSEDQELLELLAKYDESEDPGYAFSLVVNQEHNFCEAANDLGRDLFDGLYVNDLLEVPKQPVDNMIDHHFNTDWCFDDFFSGYLQANDIDITFMSDEEVKKEKEFCMQMMTPELLNGLRESIVQDINEKICFAMKK